MTSRVLEMQSILKNASVLSLRFSSKPLTPVLQVLIYVCGRQNDGPPMSSIAYILIHGTCGQITWQKRIQVADEIKVANQPTLKILRLSLIICVGPKESQVSLKVEERSRVGSQSDAGKSLACCFWL